MDKSISELIETTAVIIAGLLMFTYICLLFKGGRKYDEALIEQTRAKQSVTQSYAYLGQTREYTPAEILSEIISSNDTFYIEKNGVRLDNDKIAKAKAQNSSAIAYLKNTFNKSYQKKYIISPNGEVIGLNFTD